MARASKALVFLARCSLPPRGGAWSTVEEHISTRNKDLTGGALLKELSATSSDLATVAFAPSGMKVTVGLQRRKTCRHASVDGARLSTSRSRSIGKGANVGGGACGSHW